LSKAFEDKQSKTVQDRIWELEAMCSAAAAVIQKHAAFHDAIPSLTADGVKAKLADLQRVISEANGDLHATMGLLVPAWISIPSPSRGVKNLRSLV